MFHEKEKNLIIYENPGLNATPSYDSTLFSVFNKIRRKFDTPQRPSIYEGNLCTNFPKLLDNVHSNKQSFGSIHNTIIIIFDGIDIIKEKNGREESAEWLPINLSSSFKIIYTCCKGSEAEIFLSERCKVVEVPQIGLTVRKSLFKEYLTKFQDMEKSENAKSLKRFIRKSEGCANPLYLKMVITWGLSSFPSIPYLVLPACSEIKGLKELLNYSISFFSPYCNNSIKKVLGCLVLSKYGLSFDEISLSSGVSIKTTGKILQIYDNIIIKHQDLYFFSNFLFREACDLDFLPSLSKEIAFTLQEKNNIERVQELLHFLHLSENWKLLREKLRDIRVFTYLYNQHSRLEICKYWVELEKNNFDPVEEYNRCLEDFIISNQTLKNEDTVMVLLNFFSFFQEYSFLECPKGAVFRNFPLISLEIFEEINLKSEIKKYPDIFNPNPISPILSPEKLMFEEQRIDLFREKVLKIDQEIEKLKPKNDFHFKRWLWIQFPWLILSQSINSSAMLAMFKDSSPLCTVSKEKEFNESLLAIVTSEEKSKPVLKTRPQTTKPMIQRSATTHAMAKRLGFPKNSLHTDPKENSAELNTSHSNTLHSMSREPKKEKPVTYAINFSMKDTVINTVLLKLDSQLVEFSQIEYNKKHKEVRELHKIFNKLIEARRIKENEITVIETQISQLQAKYKEKEEVIHKMNTLQYQTNKNLEKIVLAESEGEYLEKILVCCEKNQPFDPEWKNEIVNAIECCEKFIQHENAQIDLYVQDTFEYNFRSNKLKPLMAEKKKFGTNTLEKLSEKYSLNAYINKQIVKGFNRRKLLLTMPAVKDSSKTMIKTMKNRTLIKSKIKVAKSYLDKKKHNYEELFTKIKQVSKEKDTIDISGIISKFQERVDLIQQKQQIEINLNDMKLEKIHLEEKLKYLEISEPISKDHENEVPKDFHTISEDLQKAETRFYKLESIVKEQDLKIIKIKELVYHLFKKLKIEEPVNITPENLRKVLRKLGQSIKEISFDEPKNEITMIKNEGDISKPHIGKLWDALSEKFILL